MASAGFACPDPKNFHAARLVINDPADGQARFAALSCNKRPIRACQVVLLFLMRTKSMQHVRMEIKGNGFAAYVTASWWITGRTISCRRAAGFFSDSGDRFRLRWASVTYQYDLLGRLCSAARGAAERSHSRSD
jgi:hypothetical protein